MTVELIEGDCREILKELDANSIDAIVTDPPYGLEFMGKAWDYDVPGTDVWTEVLRVLKPGGHLLSFFGTRTYHRGVVKIEDAGFEIRDQIGWLYGSGFPKSSNQDGEWEGRGTALKPAWEPIVMARKPLIGTVPQNLAAHGVGALNIADCRVGDEVRHAAFTSLKPSHGNRLGAPGTAELRRGTQGDPKEYVGRWPANIIHDGSDDVLAAFPQARGQIADASSSSEKRKTQNVYGAMRRGNGRDGEPSADSSNEGAVGFKMKPGMRRGDTGSAARFFYCAKASKSDRDDGLSEFAPVARANGNKWTDQDYRVARGERPPSAESGPRKNTHPTVKPTELMRYLCRLVTPPGGTVLDPFMGSGSTGRGAVLEGFNFIGIEMSAEYFDLADARIVAAEATATKTMQAAE